MRGKKEELTLLVTLNSLILLTEELFLRDFGEFGLSSDYESPFLMY